MLYLQCIEVFAIAASVTFLELVTSKYPRTLCLVSKSQSLYIYACIYGLFGIAINLGYPLLFSPGVADGLHTSGATPQPVTWSSNPWVRAALIGFTVKALLHVRVFELTTSPGKSILIGVETITQLFEPLLLRNIGLEHWIALRKFLAPAAAKYPVLADARERELAAIPTSFDATERGAMTNDLNAAASVPDVLQIYLTNVGCRGFASIFP
jgi:hypothetical protein